MFQLLKYKYTLPYSLSQTNSYSICHSLQHSFGADYPTLVGRLRNISPVYREALKLFCLRQQIVSLGQAAMLTHSMLKLCFNFVLGIILLASQTSATPLNRYDNTLARRTSIIEANNS